MYVHVYCLLGQTEGQKKGLFSRGEKDAEWNYPQEHLAVITDKKLYPFVKFEMIQSLLFY